MLISVITTVYNCEEFIEEAVQSILDQTHSDLEYIIIDDASTDKTYEILERYKAKDNRIKLFRMDENVGTYKCRNFALKHITGEIVTFHDADDYSLSNRLEVELDCLLKNDCLLVIAKYLRVYCHKDWILINGDIRTRKKLDISVNSLKECEKYNNITHFYKRYRHRNRMALVTAMYRASVFDEIIFDENRFGADAEHIERLFAVKCGKYIEGLTSNCKKLIREKHPWLKGIATYVDQILYLARSREGSLERTVGINSKKRIDYTLKYRKKIKELVNSNLTP